MLLDPVSVKPFIVKGHSCRYSGLGKTTSRGQRCLLGGRARGGELAICVAAKLQGTVGASGDRKEAICGKLQKWGRLNRLAGLISLRADHAWHVDWTIAVTMDDSPTVKT